MMVARRTLLAAGAVLPAAPLAARVAAGSPSGRMLLFHDPRNADSRRFAESALALDHAVRLAGASDLVRQWRDHAAPGTAIGGLTSYADMLIALGMAAEEQRAVLLTSSHRTQGERRLHAVHRGNLSGLAEAGAAWPRLVAARMSGLKAEVAASADMPRQGSLWSWMVAARR